jgi:chloride channel 7
LSFGIWGGLNCFFVLLATLLTNFVAPIAASSGVPEVKCFLNGLKMPEVFP